MDDVVTSADTSTVSAGADTNAASVDTSNNSADIGSPENNSMGNVGLIVDPATGERHLEFSEKPLINTTNDENRQGVPEAVAQAAEPQYYTDTELMNAFNSGSVDQTKISPAQAQFINNQRAAYMAEVQARRRQIEEQHRMEQEAQQRQIQSFAGLGNYAHQMALKAINMTQTDFNDIEFVANSEQLKAAYKQAYDQAYADGAYQIAERNVLQKQHIQQFQNGINEVSKFVQNEQRTEPRHNEIMQMMNEAIKKMPYETAVEIQQAWDNITQRGICSQKELATIRKYHDYCKKKVYQQNANVTKVPQRTAVPKVEHTGQPNPQSGQQPMDWSKLKGLNEYERGKAIRQYIKNYL